MKSSEKGFQEKENLYIWGGSIHFYFLCPFGDKRKPFREELIERAEFQSTRKEQVFYAPQHFKSATFFLF